MVAVGEAGAIVPRCIRHYEMREGEKDGPE